MSISRRGCHQFAVIIDQSALRTEIFRYKGTKQRFLDYALKRGVKEGILRALYVDGIRKEDVDGVSVVVDEHSTSTSGKYNLKESINEELLRGMFNPNWNRYIPPVFTHAMPEISVCYVDSCKVPLVRAADVTANWVYMSERDKDSIPGAMAAVAGRVTILNLP